MRFLIVLLSAALASAQVADKAKIAFSGQTTNFLSNSLATVQVKAELKLGKGKDLYKQNWNVVETWVRDAGGTWHIRGFVANGFGDVWAGH